VTTFRKLFSFYENLNFRIYATPLRRHQRNNIVIKSVPNPPTLHRDQYELLDWKHEYKYLQFFVFHSYSVRETTSLNLTINVYAVTGSESVCDHLQNRTWFIDMKWCHRIGNWRQTLDSENLKDGKRNEEFRVYRIEPQMKTNTRQKEQLMSRSACQGSFRLYSVAAKTLRERCKSLAIGQVQLQRPQRPRVPEGISFRSAPMIHHFNYFIYH
jgi:hypothetical protein